MLTTAGCQQRLDRLRHLLAAERIDVGLITHPKHVYYFSGFLAPWHERALLAVDQHAATLVCSRQPAATAASAVRVCELQSLATIRPDQSQRIAAMLGDLIRPAGRVGTEWSTCDARWARLVAGELVDLQPAIERLRRRKDPDELALLRKSAECIDACYRYAAGVVEPGLDELDLYSGLHRAAVATAGEPIGRFGNDFQSGTPGGPPRRRRAREGELWILDLSVEYRGYAADACRVFAVGSAVTDQQYAAWEKIHRALAFAEQRARPGGSCSELYEQVKRQLDDARPAAFPHHLGHGIGLDAHEAPRLNPCWDDCFAEGDVVTIEPGLYHDSLRGGLRIENDYVITAHGAEPLNAFPLEIHVR